jgi:murein DD-endopeptidase MepM/ murein hydrolase activator NlpD
MIAVFLIAATATPVHTVEEPLCGWMRARLERYASTGVNTEAMERRYQERCTREVPTAAGGAEPGDGSTHQQEIVDVRTLSVTSSYGLRRDPLGRREQTQFHTGVDLKCQKGLRLGALVGGRVVRVGVLGDAGLVVDIVSRSAIRVRYAHGSRSFVRVGDTVSPGMPIIACGSTGRSTGPHVHIEVMSAKGRRVDPVPFLKARAPGGGGSSSSQSATGDPTQEVL